MTTNTRTPADIANDIAREPFAWPGGYERWALTDDGGELCWRCCRKERDAIATSAPGDGWYVVGEFAACNVDSLSHCDNCNAPLLPSGYASVDEYHAEHPND